MSWGHVCTQGPGWGGVTTSREPSIPGGPSEDGFWLMQTPFPEMDSWLLDRDTWAVGLFSVQLLE